MVVFESGLEDDPNEGVDVLPPKENPPVEGAGVGAADVAPKEKPPAGAAGVAGAAVEEDPPKEKAPEGAGD